MEPPTNPFLIQTWLLALPLDPSGPEMAWLAKAADRLNVPFKVEWRPPPFLEGLVTDARLSSLVGRTLTRAPPVASPNA